MSNRSTLLLEHHLKELKLPSFLREYGKMAAQCAAENVDHPEYLLRLAEMESGEKASHDNRSIQHFYERGRSSRNIERGSGAAVSERAAPSVGAGYRRASRTSRISS